MGKYHGDVLVNLSALDAHHANAGFLGPYQPGPSTDLRNGLHLRVPRRPWSGIFDNVPLAQRVDSAREDDCPPTIAYLGERMVLGMPSYICARGQLSKPI